MKNVFLILISFMLWACVDDERFVEINSNEEIDTIQEKEIETLPTILIRKREGELFSINETLMEDNKLKVKLAELIDNFNKDEKERYIVRIEVEEQVKMKELIKLREILQGLGASRLHYKKLENSPPSSRQFNEE